LQQAQAGNPLNPEIYFQIGSAYFRSGKLAEALDVTGRALLLDDEDPRYHALLSDIYSKMNRGADSRAATQRATQLKSRAGYQAVDPYISEMRRRDDAATVKEICGYDTDR